LADIAPKSDGRTMNVFFVRKVFGMRARRDTLVHSPRERFAWVRWTSWCGSTL